MANQMYDFGRNSFARGDSAWRASGGSTFKATLCTAGYTASLATHQYMNTNTVPLAARLSTVTLATLDPVAGVMDANDPTFPSVSGSPGTQVVVWKDGGGGGTTSSGTADVLILRIDTATGLPVTPDGTDIDIVFDNGANKICKL